MLKSYIHQHYAKFLSSIIITINEGNTWRPNSRETFRRVMSGKLSMSVAILNASWASLKMCEEEWMFFWMDSNTVSSLRTSPARCKQNHQNGTSFRNTQRSFIIDWHWLLCNSMMFQLYTLCFQKTSIIKWMKDIRDHKLLSEGVSAVQGQKSLWSVNFRTDFCFS